MYIPMYTSRLLRCNQSCVGLQGGHDAPICTSARLIISYRWASGSRSAELCVVTWGHEGGSNGLRSVGLLA